MKLPRLPLATLLSALALSVVLAGAASASTLLEREFRYDAARVHLSRAADGTTEVLMRAAAREETPGHPDLPVIGERVELPVGVRLAEVRVLGFETALLASEARVPAAAKPVHGLGVTERTTPDPAVYGSAGYVPAQLAWVGAQGFERGRNIAYVGVAPVRWEPTTGRLERLVGIRVQLVLEADAARPLERERVVPEWEEGGAATVASTAATRAALRPPGGKVAEPFKATQLPSLLGSPVEYVIITDDAMAPVFQELADWKTQCGVPAVVRTMSFIQEQYPQGADDAERVRSFIRDAYTRWGTKWVLLGGDTDVIPVRLAYTTYYNSEHIATDLYYQCLDGNWNADGDSLYGEGRVSYPVAYGDTADLMPEVYVGRLPASSAAEAQLLVDKTMKYETDPVSDYLQSLLFFAEVLFPQDWVPGQTTTLDGATFIENDILPIMDEVPDQRYARLYENYMGASWRAGALPETRAIVIDSLNRGYNLAVHVGHGYRNVMHVADDNLTNADALALSNGDRLINLYAINCSSASIDYPCIAEALMKAPSGGAVTLVGSTRYDFPNTGRLFQEEYFDLLYLQDVSAIGELHAKQKLPWVASSTYDGTNRWTEMTLILLGDPELHIWTATPRALSVTCPGSLAITDTVLTVNVEADEAALEGARVTVYRAGDVFASALTDEAGDAALALRPDSLGTLTLTVTGFNCRPYQTTIAVVAASGPELAERSVLVSDGDLGNGDGYWNAGETVDLFPAVANAGGASAVSVTGALSTTDTLVTIVQGAADYGTIAVGDSASPATGLRVSLPYDAGDQREVPFQLRLADTGGNSFLLSFRLTVRAPELKHYRHTAIDVGGDSDGRPDAGETLQYFVTLRNVGTGPALGVSGRLRNLDGLATVTDSTASWGDIEPGVDATSSAFEFVASSVSATLQLEVTDMYGQRLLQTLDLGYPAAPVSLAGVGGAGSISLTWGHVAESDLLGYYVYRSTSSTGTYTRVTPVPTDRTSYYLDSGLASLTRYYYKVSAVDRSGNESSPSTAQSVSTNPPLHSIFPMPTGRETPSPVLLDHLYDGYPLDIVVGASLLYVWHSDGTGPVDADGSGSTPGDFTKLGNYYAAGASVADLDGTGKTIVAPCWYDNSVYAYDLAGALKTGWPVVLSDNLWSSIAIGDVDGDGLKEMAFGSNGTHIYALRADGTELLDGDGNPSTLGIFKTLTVAFNPAAAAIAPLQNDGTQAIVYGGADGYLHAWRPDGGNVPGFPVNLGYGNRSSPAVGSLDGEGGDLSIVVNPMSDSLYVIKPDGGRRAGFPVYLRTQGMSKTPSPALADMDGDGKLDIVACNTLGGIYVWNGSGQIVKAPNLASWSNIRYSTLTSGAAECSPVVADINGDSHPDVLMADEEGKLTAISGADATVLPGFPIQCAGAIRGAPAVGDIDGDGMTEIVVADWDKNSCVYAWDYDFPFSPCVVPPWPQFHHDPLRSGYAATLVPGDVGGGGQVPVAVQALELAPAAPNPTRGTTRLWYGVPANRTGAALELTIYDLSGRRVRTLEQGTAQAGRHSAAWDLRDASGAPVGPGVYFARLTTGPEWRTRKLVVVR